MVNEGRGPHRSKCHGLVLQIALAGLVAYRAVQRVVHQQELHHSLPAAPSKKYRCRDWHAPRLLRHGRVGLDLHVGRHRPRARRDGLPRVCRDRIIILVAPWAPWPLRLGTCGSCRPRTGARGSRSAESQRQPSRRPGAAERRLQASYAYLEHSGSGSHSHRAAVDNDVHQVVGRRRRRGRRRVRGRGRSGRLQPGCACQLVRFYDWAVENQSVAAAELAA